MGAYSAPRLNHTSAACKPATCRRPARYLQGLRGDAAAAAAGDATAARGAFLRSRAKSLTGTPWISNDRKQVEQSHRHCHPYKLGRNMYFVHSFLLYPTLCIYIHIHTRMCTSAHGLACVCTHIYTYTYTCTYTYCFCTYIHMHAHTYSIQYVYVYVYMYVFLFTYACVNQYIHIYTYTYTYIYIYIYMYIYTYICIFTYMYACMYISSTMSSLSEDLGYGEDAILGAWRSLHGSWLEVAPRNLTKATTTRYVYTYIYI